MAMFPLIFWLVYWVPKFFQNSCAQSYKNKFKCPKFLTNPISKYTNCHISIYL